MFKYQKFKGKFENNEAISKQNIFLYEYLSVVGLELIRLLKIYSTNKFNNEPKAIPESSDFESLRSIPSKFINFEKKDHEFFDKLISTTERIYQEFKIKNNSETRKLLYPCLDELKKMKANEFATSNDFNKVNFF